MCVKERKQGSQCVPCPVCLKESRVVHDGGQQGREGPQEQSGEELGDYGILEVQTKAEHSEEKDMGCGSDKLKSFYYFITSHFLLRGDLKHQLWD